MSVKASVFLFANDLVDEGFDHVVDTIRDMAAAQAVTIACNYHHSRDVVPHNPRRKVLYMSGGVFFQPDPARFDKLKIVPDVPAFVREEDPLERLVAVAGRRGMMVRGWTNNMHSTVHASRHPDCSVRNAFGDSYITTLCPANPDVRAYVRALNGDLGRYGLQNVLVESACFMPFDHGYHHERSMVPLTPVTKFLLSLCFCQDCRAAGRHAGVAVDALKAFVCNALEKTLNGHASQLDGVDLVFSQVADLADGEMAGYLAARQNTVTTLVAELAEAVHPLRLDVMEWSGGLRAVGLGMQVSSGEGTSVSRAWKDGTDIAKVAATADGLSILGYVPEPEGLRAELRAYRDCLPEGKSLSVAMRPMFPDCASVEVLGSKLRVLEEEGVEWADFYHYAFMRLSNLAWVGESRARSGTRP